MKKLRGISITKAQGAILLTAFVTALVGGALIYLGSSSGYTALTMTAWLHFGTALLLLLNLCLPAVFSASQERLQQDALAREHLTQKEAQLQQEQADACGEQQEAPSCDKKEMHRQKKAERKGKPIEKIIKMQ